jgi:glycosyltransferase involved in cell wall biosynthesis
MPADTSSSPEAFRACLVVPVYEHHVALGRQLPELRALGLRVLLIDDGSGPECSAALRAMAVADADGSDAAVADGSKSGALHAPVRLIRREKNGGKGAAVKQGLRLAKELGFTHAVQVDADGQHDLAALPRLLEASRLEPGAVICADPVFGADAPPARRRWRRLTNFWMAVNTLSLAVADGMCGLRVYPLAAVLPLLGPSGDRMEFDPEILVRLAWAGLPLRFLPAAVRYPVDGRSGFRAFEDNVRISWMHTRLFFGMLARSPRLLLRKL